MLDNTITLETLFWKLGGKARFLPSHFTINCLAKNIVIELPIVIVRNALLHN